jgi:Rho-binding antiterminator
MEKYKPISCSFHDILLHHATLQDEVELLYYGMSEKKTLKTRLIDVVTRNGEEFLITSDGSRIRLDHVISVNVQILSHFC